ncbi:MFS transporter [Apibacter muscae]|uniref:sugar porter family MFS transporter n=1 Tax=Apibacter muscae TaxID=2509004 RepID=UPI0011AC8D0F|nr:sugar porter family MFS transporter [Apibacter muscae]TWP31021.1 MFS transporter [Apibacter muscae]
MSQGNNKYLYWITFVAVNGGLLFGLNMAGIAGANELIKKDFNLSDSGLGTIASFLMLGCLIGALFTGKFTDTYGRRKVMIGTALLFIISSLGCAFSTGFYSLTFFRVLSGFAVGATSVVGPMYIAEISPAKKRGTLVSFNQFAITIGIFLAYVFDYFLINLGDNSWRYMLAIPALFGVIYFIYLLGNFPESPRWLLANNYKDKAIKILRKTSESSDLENELREIEESIKQETSKEKIKFSELFKGKTGKVVLIGTLIAAFQQITGINAVLVFAPDIFKSAGVGADQALLQSMIVGLVNVLMTIVALKLVDSKGRKTLLLWGALGMTVCLAYLTYAFSKEEKSAIAVLLALLGYISFFAASFAPVMWVIISEIYSNRIKGVAMSFSTAVSWGCTFLTVYFTPIIRQNFGNSFLFAIFGFFSIVAYIFVKFYIPETKGKSLEQIEKELGLK